MSPLNGIRCDVGNKKWDVRMQSEKRGESNLIGLRPSRTSKLRLFLQPRLTYLKGGASYSVVICIYFRRNHYK